MFQKLLWPALGESPERYGQPQQETSTDWQRPAPEVQASRALGSPGVPQPAPWSDSRLTSPAPSWEALRLCLGSALLLFPGQALITPACFVLEAHPGHDRPSATAPEGLPLKKRCKKSPTCSGPCLAPSSAVSVQTRLPSSRRWPQGLCTTTLLSGRCPWHMFTLSPPAFCQSSTSSRAPLV